MHPALVALHARVSALEQAAREVKARLAQRGVERSAFVVRAPSLHKDADVMSVARDTTGGS